MNDPHNLPPQKEMLLNHPYSTMMSAIQCSDVVIVDSAHYAVVIKYDKTKDDPPIVVARGVNSVALEIQQIAHDHGVYRLEYPVLAQLLYSEVEETGSFIPEIFYEDIADVLAYVYKMAEIQNQ